MNQQTSPPKKLHLSNDDKKIFGVCGGIANYFGADATIIRLIWIAVTVLTGFIPGILAYIIAAIIMPKPPSSKRQ